MEEKCCNKKKSKNIVEKVRFLFGVYRDQKSVDAKARQYSIENAKPDAGFVLLRRKGCWCLNRQGINKRVKTFGFYDQCG